MFHLLHQVFYFIWLILSGAATLFSMWIVISVYMEPLDEDDYEDINDGRIS